MNKEDKEELLKEIDRRLKVLRDEFIASLDDKKEFEVQLPEDGTVFYCVYGDRSSIFTLKFNKNDVDGVALYLNNMLVKTKEEAEQRLKEQRLLFKIKKWAEIHNEGWEPDWENVSQYKYSVDYSGLLDELYATDSTVQKRFNKLPFFKSEKIAKECIGLFRDEIKEVLC